MQDVRLVCLCSSPVGWPGVFAAAGISRLVQPDTLWPAGISAAVTFRPATAVHCRVRYRAFWPEAALVESLGNRVTMVERKQGGLGDLVVTLNPEGTTSSLPLAATPTGIRQGQALSLLTHKAKLACLDMMPRVSR